MSEFEVEQSVIRCVEAFRREHGNHDEACKAFLAELPTLSGPAGIRAYLACIGRALSIGVIDLVDLGRYCHVAQLAMRAWKMAYPLPSKGNHFESSDAPCLDSEAPEGRRSPAKTSFHASAEPKNPHPLPPNGNHSEVDPIRIAAALLPDFDTQKAMYKSLRLQGFSLPSNSHLRNNPVEALYYCGMAGFKPDGQGSVQANHAA